jgi:hypothetical protein
VSFAGRMRVPALSACLFSSALLISSPVYAVPIVDLHNHVARSDAGAGAATARGLRSRSLPAASTTLPAGDACTVTAPSTPSVQTSARPRARGLSRTAAAASIKGSPKGRARRGVAGPPISLPAIPSIVPCPPPNLDENSAGPDPFLNPTAPGAADVLVETFTNPDQPASLDILEDVSIEKDDLQLPPLDFLLTDATSTDALLPVADRQPIPEPGTMGLLGAGLFGIRWFIRRRHWVRAHGKRLNAVI